jgi:DNA-binding response OmpR family regulator
VHGNVLIVNTDKPVRCFNSLEKEDLWEIKHANIRHAKEIIGRKYIDLICLEVEQDRREVWQFLKKVKNKRLKTKVLSIIPNVLPLKEKVLVYGSDDYICKPYQSTDLILRCKKLTNDIPIKYKQFYKSAFLKYNPKFNIVTYNGNYLPLTPKQIELIKILLENKYLNKKEISKYFSTKFEYIYSEEYILVLIYRTRKKIKMCTGRNLIRNNYGLGYYIL